MMTQPKPRHKFLERRISLRNETVRENVLALISNLPVSDSRPLQMIIREEAKARTLDQNALMWSGPLADIEAQAWLNGRQYSAVLWHEYYKAEYLPEEDATDLHLLVKDPFKWRKWDWTPKGDRVLVGSTTDLTKYGFSQYLEQVHADGASMGVSFSAPKGRD